MSENKINLDLFDEVDDDLDMPVANPVANRS